MNAHISSCAAISAGLLSMAAGITAQAETHAPHVHGEADIAVILEGSHVSVSLMSAMYNITGFEHAPESDTQHEILNAAITLLDDGSQLFSLSPEAACSSTHSEHSLKPEHNGEETHQGPDPEEDHSHSHRDLQAEYEFTCDNPSSLQEMRIRMFDHFGNLERVNAVIISDNQQSAQEVTAAKPVVSLR